MIHPFFNAHFGLVQLMLNHLCQKGSHRPHTVSASVVAAGPPAALMSNGVVSVPPDPNASDARERQAHRRIDLFTKALPPPSRHMT